MTPAEELHAAAERLRAAILPGGVGAPLATLLERKAQQAAEIEQYLGSDFQDGALDQDIHDALAVAREILGVTDPSGPDPCSGCRYVPCNKCVQPDRSQP